MYMEGCAAKAVSAYRGGSIIQPFDAECTLLQEWTKQEGVGFAPVHAKTTSRMSGPYLLPQRKGGEKQPLSVSSDVDFAEMHQQARILLKDTKPECFRVLFAGSAEDRRKRSLEQVKAADQYCAAVVQHSALLDNMPSLSEYIEEVCPKRLAVSHDDEDEAKDDVDGGGKREGGEGVVSES